MALLTFGFGTGTGTPPNQGDDDIRPEWDRVVVPHWAQVNDPCAVHNGKGQRHADSGVGASHRDNSGEGYAGGKVFFACPNATDLTAVLINAVVRPK